jgi:hypothetical protein
MIGLIGIIVILAILWWRSLHPRFDPRKLLLECEAEFLIAVHNQRTATLLYRQRAETSWVELCHLLALNTYAPDLDDELLGVSDENVAKEAFLKAQTELKNRHERAGIDVDHVKLAFFS